MKLFFINIFLLSSLAIASFAVAGEDVYQTPEAFIAETFDGALPPTKTLNISANTKAKIEKIMGSHYKLPHAEYSMQNGRTVWILEEIGKFEPITAGFVVGANGKIERIKVLIYRESHGWEVKHGFFTRQFKNAGLKREKKLDKRIDGISGATLSVNALKRLSALALTLHQAVGSES